MTSQRSPLIWSLVLHGGAIGTAMALAVGSAAEQRPILRIAVLPAEASVAIAASAPPEETVAIEREQREVDPLPHAEAAREPEVFAAQAREAAFECHPAPAERRAADWLMRVERPPVATPPAPQPPAVESTPAPVREQARVVAVIPGLDPKPEYPAQARRLGWQGVTEVGVEVAEDGTVLSTSVVQSSGYRVLDRAALRAVRTWRFQGGAGQTKVIVEFRLTA